MFNFSWWFDMMCGECGGQLVKPTPYYIKCNCGECGGPHIISHHKSYQMFNFCYTFVMISDVTTWCAVNAVVNSSSLLHIISNVICGEWGGRHIISHHITNHIKCSIFLIHLWWFVMIWYDVQWMRWSTRLVTWYLPLGRPANEC